jgi:ankyrin repeat protein
MLKLWIIALALLLTQQTSPMLNFPHETAWEKFKCENPKGNALIDAAAEGDIAKVQMLLAEGVNVNARDPNGYTALHCAAINNHETLCKLLIKHSAHTNCGFNGEPMWKTIILASINNDFAQNFKVAELLFNPYNLPTKKACSQAIITFLHCVKKRKKENDINLLFSNHWKTLLKPHFAYIMRMAPDVNKKNKVGQTALMEATNRGAFNSCEWLIHHGAEGNIQTINSYGTHTALSIARGAQQYAKTRLGKDRSAPSSYEEYTRICELLIANGAIEDEAN